MRKIKISVLILTLILSIFNQNIYAASNKIDKNMTNDKASILRAPGDYGHYYTHKVIRRRRVDTVHEFIGYVSGCDTWSHTSEYELTSENASSIGFTFRYENVEVELKVSFPISLGRHIPADPNRPSKLGFFADFDVYKETVLWEEHNYGKVVKTWTTEDNFVPEIIEDSKSLEVVYR